MVEFEIHPGKICLIIIDMTKAFLSPGAVQEIPGGRSLIPKLNRLLGVCRDKGLLIVFTTHVYRRDGCDFGLHPDFRPAIKMAGLLSEGSPNVEFHSEIQPQKGDIVIAKRRFSAFIGTELDLILRGNGIDTLIIGGVATNTCCDSTARDARMRDYKVIFLSDGTAATRFPDMGWGEVSAEEVQRNVLTSVSYQFGQVLSIDEVIRQLSDL